MGRLRDGRRGSAAVKVMLSALSVVAAAAVMLVGLGPGLAAAADPLVGKKYSDAASWVNRRGGTPVVSTVAGSQLALDDCVVTSWSRGGFLNSSGKNDRRREYYLHLNCNNTLASPGHPGNSLMTPEGAKRKAQERTAARLNERPEQCQRSESMLESCRRFCNNTGLCKFEL